MDDSVANLPSRNDENDQKFNKLDSQGEMPKKKTSKNYMAPTVSAASKAIASKKKILGERNEDADTVSSDTLVKKSQNLDAKSSFDSENKVGKQPYDPLTNYLSPRPKFLRYNPNRRREILRRRGEEEKDGMSLSGSFDSEKASVEEDGANSGPESCLSSPQEGSVVQDLPEIDQSDEEIEEFEEERGWSFRGVLKNLALFAVLVLFAFYVSSMNSHMASPAVRVINDGWYKIQSQFVEAVNSLQGGRFVSDDMANRELDSLMEVNGRAINEVNHHEEVLEDVGRADSSDDIMSEVAVEEFSLGNEIVDQQTGETDVGGLEMVKEEKFSSQESDVTTPSGFRNLETVAASESLEDNWEQSVPDEDNLPDIVNNDQLDFEETNEAVMESDGEVCNEEIGNQEPFDAEIDEVEDTVDETDVRMDEEKTDLEMLNDDAEEQSEEESRNLVVGTIIGTIIGSAIVYVIVRSIVLRFLSKPSRRKASVSAKPCAEALVTEKSSSVLEIEEKNDNKHVDTLEEPEHLVHSRTETYEEFSKSQAPSVELLGEFVFRDLSSTNRSYGTKPSTEIERESSKPVASEKKSGSKLHLSMLHREPESPDELSEMSISTLRGRGRKIRGVEVEKENTQPVSLEKKPESKTHSSTLHSEPDASEFSASPSSYGTFTAEKKIVKGSGDGEVKVITTPVRRSSRIRTRGVLSP